MFIRSTIIVGLSVFALMSCANEKSAKPGTDDKSLAGGVSAASDPLCIALKANATTNSGDYAPFLNELCDSGKLTILRASPYYYKGSGNPEVMQTATQNGADSNMRLWASFATQSNAKAYFNMMRLQIDKPSEFDDPTTSGTAFEIDSNVTYTRKSGDGSSTSYRYLNTKEDVAVEYEATSSFVEVSSGKIYAVTSKSDSGISVVRSLKGLQVINELSDGTTEIFSIADQTYDNRGDHASMTSKAENAFKEDMAKAFRNAQHASDANKFYP